MYLPADPEYTTSNQSPILNDEFAIWTFVVLSNWSTSWCAETHPSNSPATVIVCAPESASHTNLALNPSTGDVGNVIVEVAPGVGTVITEPDWALVTAISWELNAPTIMFLNVPAPESTEYF